MKTSSWSEFNYYLQVEQESRLRQSEDLSYFLFFCISTIYYL